MFCCEAELEVELVMDVDALMVGEARAEVCFLVHFPGLAVERGGALVELRARDEVLAGAVWEGRGPDTVTPLLPKYSVYVATTGSGVGGIEELESS